MSLPSDCSEALVACERLAAAGQVQSCLAKSQALLAQAQSLKLERLQGQAGHWLAHSLLRQGELDACRQAGQAALGCLTGLPDWRSRVHCTLTLACAQALAYPEALHHADQALREAELSGNAKLKAWALNRLGATQVDLGDTRQGRALLQQSLEMARQHADLELQFAAHNNLGTYLNWRSLGRLAPGETHEEALTLAAEHLRLAQELAQRMGHPVALALSEANLAWLLREQGDLPASLTHARQALELAQAASLAQVASHARLEEALTLIELGDAQAAHVLLQLNSAGLSARDHWGQMSHWRALVQAQRALQLFEPALHSQQRYYELAMDEVRVRNELHLLMLRRQHELDLARAQAHRAKLEAEMQRLRAEQMRREAHEDMLTGLYNRRFVAEQLPVLRVRSQALGRPLLALMLDVDHFKQVNDRLGHRAGDQVLRELGSLLLQHTRVSDLAARMGGEEFLLLMPDTEPSRALDVAERLRTRVAEHDWGPLAPGQQVTISLGLAPVAEGEAALEPADAALYRAKAEGRNCVRCSWPDPGGSSAPARHTAPGPLV